MKKNLFIILILVSIIHIFNIKTSSSQVGELWIQRYNGTGDSTDYANAMVVDAAGNVYVTGGSLSFGAPYYDCVTIKYNSDGMVQWLQRYNGPGDSTDNGYSLAVDDSGNVYVTGSSFGSGSNTDYVTIKYNSEGVQQWVQRYNGTGNAQDNAYAIFIDVTGYIYVTGTSTGSGNDYDGATIKYNAAGVQQWVQRYSGPGNSTDSPSSIVVDGSGNVYIAGYSVGIGTSLDCLTLKYNSAGVLQWEKRYNGPGNTADNINSLAVDDSGNVYIAGFIGGSGTGNDGVTIKYNTSGVQQWMQTFNGPGNGNDNARSLALDADGNVYITGYSTGSTLGADFTTIKYNSAGVQQWLQTYNGPGNGDEDAYSLVLDAMGNIYITGYSAGSGTSLDCATVKYNSQGVQQWQQRYNGPGNGYDEARKITIDTSGNVYIAGTSRGLTSASDYVVIKYSQTIGIQTISSEVPSGYRLEQNYPNPFNPVTNIKFSVPKSGFVSLKVFDISGKEVSSLVSSVLNAGVYNYELDASGLSSGAYFYRLSTENFNEVRKMILVK
ncbi:MAG: SBBP repeat-containing protein [Ignavibacteria bacterium]|nr:SBBP repeat-containing protein [Ignavibacteria bacterium]